MFRAFFTVLLLQATTIATTNNLKNDVQFTLNPEANTTIPVEKKTYQLINTTKESSTTATATTFYDINTMLKNRNSTICYFAKILKKNIKPNIREICKNVNKYGGQLHNFNLINKSEELFTALLNEADRYKYPQHKMKIVYFLGITGSGKSTLTQLLSGDNSRLYSTSTVDNGYVINDYDKISINTANSQTLYPDLVEDGETRITLCDNPGFQDTRGEIHQILQAYSMTNILKHTETIKIAFIVKHDALRIGGDRIAFIKTLKDSLGIINNVHKFKRSFYLIANKVENSFRKSKTGFVMNTDETIINGIAAFLKEVRNTLTDQMAGKEILELEQILINKKIIDIIDSLLLQKNGSYMRIDIFRKPMDPGALSGIELIQENRRRIRDMLLTEDNMVPFDDKDFGFAIQQSAQLYLNDLFRNINNNMIALSEIIGQYIIRYDKHLLNSNTVLSEYDGLLKDMRLNMKQLSNEIGKTKNPGQYADLLSVFSEKRNLELDCLDVLKNLKKYNEFLISFESMTSTTEYYTPQLWNSSMMNNYDFISNRMEQYNYLNDLFQTYSSYEYNKKNKKLTRNIIVNETNFDHFFNTNDLKKNYQQKTFIDADFFRNLNSVLTFVEAKNQSTFKCENETVYIIDNFMVLSDIDFDENTQLCSYDKVVFIAMHTIFIDKDLEGPAFAGKDVIIISPTWEVIGSRRLSVDGLSGGAKKKKAALGEVGTNGINGKPAGTFTGIGEIFKNTNYLTISACGGNGQDGQDGGDGEDGKDGSLLPDSSSWLRSSNLIPLIVVNFKYEEWIVDSDPGMPGGSAGSGGYGGIGGKKGTVTMFNVGSGKEHEIKLLVEDGSNGIDGKDGTPGKGGFVGCRKKINNKKTYILFFNVAESKNEELFDCDRRSTDGTVRPNYAFVNTYDGSVTKEDHPVCPYIKVFRDLFINKYVTCISDGLTQNFINNMIDTKF